MKPMMLIVEVGGVISSAEVPEDYAQALADWLRQVTLDFIRPACPSERDALRVEACLDGLSEVFEGLGIGQA